jgi:medium-chain acyl-[acyl-carrier-protein] hydrolase
MTLSARVTPSGQRSPVSCHRPQPAAQVRLVAFAHAGGGPMTFRHWARELAPQVELWNVTLPGRAARWREPFAREWTPLADALAAAIARDVPGPVALFGHSLGALLAFEVARRLTRARVPPVHLIVSGRGAPDVAPALELPDTDAELLRHVDLLYGGIPDAVRASQELLDHFLPILRADLELARAYALRPGMALTCPIMAMTGDADPIAPPRELQRWSRQTGAGCELRVHAGGHFYLADRESAALSTILGRLLA